MNNQCGYVEEGHTGRGAASAKAGMGVVCSKKIRQVGMTAAH